MLSTLLKRRTVSSLPSLATRLRCYSTPSGPNNELIQILSQYMEDEKDSAASNSYKVQAYARAIDVIRHLPEQVQSVDQVKHLKGIGVRITKRIDAYLSGTPYEPPKPKKAKNVELGTSKKTTPDELRKRRVVSSLIGVKGIGSSKAKALYDAGCRSLQDLRKPKFYQTLSRLQQIHVQYRIGNDHSMTSEQASTIHDFVVQNISSKYTVLLGGDFRRGKDDAQHITLIILHAQNTGIFPPEGSPSVDSTIKQKFKHEAIPTPFASLPENRVKSNSLPEGTPFSTEIISPLGSRGLLATTLTAGIQRWHGIIRVPERTQNDNEGQGWETRAERVQRVQDCEGQFFSAEIYYVPHQSAGAALIALTGDNPFNLAVRKAASRLGFRLNEYGLWKWRDTDMEASAEDVDKRKNVEGYDGYWELVASEREEDVLDAVEMGWVPPERRNFMHLDSHAKRQKKSDEL